MHQRKFTKVAVSSVVLLLLVLVAWWAGTGRSASQPRQAEAARRDPVPGASPLPGRVAEPEEDGALVASRAVEHLRPQAVLSRETVVSPDGGRVEHALLRTGEKYPLIVLQREFEPARSPAAPPKLRRERAYPADHILLTPRPGATVVQLGAAAMKLGFTPLREVGAGLMVATRQADAAGVDEAIHSLLASGLAAAAEPDYLVFSCEEPMTVPVVEQAGRLLDPFRQDWVDRSGGPGLGPLEMSPQAATPAPTERLAALPAGGRVLTFDPPDGRRGDFRPEVRMHNFLVSTLAMRSSQYSSVYVQNAYTSGYPYNGGNYLRSLTADLGVILEHKDHLPFDAVSVDLSEYSTVFAYPALIVFNGYRADGEVVTQSFSTDGVIDGPGALADFQTFTFNGSFHDLVKLEAVSSAFMIDNLLVILKGEETPLPAPPAAPLVYSVDWNGSPHAVNAPSGVSGPDAPSSHNFGMNMVRASLGQLRERPLELSRRGFWGGDDPYGQIRFDLELHAAQYALEFDVSKVEDDPLALFLDCAGGLIRIDFYSSAIIASYSGTGGASFGPVSYDPLAANHVRVVIDFAAGSWSFELNGQPKFSGSHQTGAAELKAIRFGLTDGGSPGGVGIDNVRISATGITPPPVGPRLVLTPTDRLYFTKIPQGTKLRRRVNLLNDGTQNLVVSAITSDNPAFSAVGPFPLNVLPGATTGAEIEFAPGSNGDFQATMTVASNDPDHPFKTLALIGSASGFPVATLAPSALEVSILAGTQGQKSFVLRNDGNETLDWHLVRLSESEPLPTPMGVDDTRFSAQWGIRQSEQAGCDAVRAWTLTTGSPGVLVAVIDTGADLAHPDLMANLAHNEAEIPGNGVDDDGNGYVDDYAGWDFSANDNDPTDAHGHGTHVSGIVSAQGNNSLGVAGVAWTGRILPVQFLNAQGSGFTSDAVLAVDYARQRGARVINASWGGGGISLLLQDAISAFMTQNRGLVVAAAGNSSGDNDAESYYPAGYPGVIAVAASTSGDALASYSNFGFTTVALAAPGSDVLGCYRGGGYAYMSGTSMAAPHVAGAAALLLAQNSAASGTELRASLLNWVDFPPAFNGRTISGGRLNAYRSLKRVVLPWLTPSATSGSLSPASMQQTIDLGVDARNLAAGMHDTSLAFVTNDPVHQHLLLPVRVKVMPVSPLSAWQLEQFGARQLLVSSAEAGVWAGLADPDGDGLVNLLEYGLGSSPQVASTQAASVTHNATEGWVYHFETQDSAGGVSFRVEWSRTLAPDSWSSSGLRLEAINNAEGKTQWKAVFSDANFRPEGIFFRLVVSTDGESQ